MLGFLSDLICSTTQVKREREREKREEKKNGNRRLIEKYPTHNAGHCKYVYC